MKKYITTNNKGADGKEQVVAVPDSVGSLVRDVESKSGRGGPSKVSDSPPAISDYDSDLGPRPGR